MYRATQCVPGRSSGSAFPTKAEGTFNLLGSLFLAYNANPRGEYYDPTGRPSFLRAYVNFMNKHCTSWTYNTIRVQEEGSTVCRHHCICYLIHRWVVCFWRILLWKRYWYLGVFSVRGQSLRCSSKHCSQTRLVCFYQFQWRCQIREATEIVKTFVHRLINKA
jgi:hypothetical protein